MIFWDVIDIARALYLLLFSVICNNSTGCRELSDEVRALAVEDGDIVMPYIIYPYDYHKYQDSTRKVLLLYINENIFEHIGSVHITL